MKIADLSPGQLVEYYSGGTEWMDAIVVKVNRKTVTIDVPVPALPTHQGMTEAKVHRCHVTPDRLRRRRSR